MHFNNVWSSFNKYRVLFFEIHSISNLLYNQRHIRNDLWREDNMNSNNASFKEKKYGIMYIASNAIYEVLESMSYHLFFEEDELLVSFSKRNLMFKTHVAFKIAKFLNTTPKAISEEIKTKLTTHFFDQRPILYTSSTTTPGVIEIKLTNELIVEYYNKIQSVDFLNDKHFIIDYSSPNIAKRMHVGHLRSTFIGDALKGILQSAGAKVTSDNHIGDWGTQFGKIITMWKEEPELTFDNVTLQDIERLYHKFSESIDDAPSLLESARYETMLLQQRNHISLGYWSKILSLSMEEYNSVYQMLNIDFDYTRGESYYDHMFDNVVERLEKAEISHESNGAIIVDLGDKLGTTVIKKDDGSYLYSTSDIATVLFKEKEAAYTSAIYVTDSRQEKHFSQVFEICKKLKEFEGSSLDLELEHVSYGLFKLKNQPMASRSGNVINAKDLISFGINKSLEELSKRYPDDENKRNLELAKKICINSMRYFDISRHREKNIEFDWDDVFSTSGNTALYQMYILARGRSILKGAKDLDIVPHESNIDYKEISDSFYGLRCLFELSKFSSALSKSIEYRKPSFLCSHLYQVSKSFNGFYSYQLILSEDDLSATKTNCNIVYLYLKHIERIFKILNLYTVNYL